jgi:hypothetical protein
MLIDYRVSPESFSKVSELYGRDLVLEAIGVAEMHGSDHAFDYFISLKKFIQARIIHILFF